MKTQAEILLTAEVRMEEIFQAIGHISDEDKKIQVLRHIALQTEDEYAHYEMMFLDVFRDTAISAVNRVQDVRLLDLERRVIDGVKPEEEFDAWKFFLDIVLTLVASGLVGLIFAGGARLALNLILNSTLQRNAILWERLAGFGMKAAKEEWVYDKMTWGQQRIFNAVAAFDKSAISADLAQPASAGMESTLLTALKSKVSSDLRSTILAESKSLFSETKHPNAATATPSSSLLGKVHHAIYSKKVETVHRHSIIKNFLLTSDDIGPETDFPAFFSQTLVGIVQFEEAFKNLHQFYDSTRKGYEIMVWNFHLIKYLERKKSGSKTVYDDHDRLSPELTDYLYKEFVNEDPSQISLESEKKKEHVIDFFLDHKESFLKPGVKFFRTKDIEINLGGDEHLDDYERFPLIEEELRRRAEERIEDYRKEYARFLTAALSGLQPNLDNKDARILILPEDRHNDILTLNQQFGYGVITPENSAIVMDSGARLYQILYKLEDNRWFTHHANADGFRTEIHSYHDRVIKILALLVLTTVNPQDLPKDIYEEFQKDKALVLESYKFDYTPAP